MPPQSAKEHQKASKNSKALESGSYIANLQERGQKDAGKLPSCLPIEHRQ